MSGVAELLASEADAAPVQRVRNYHLTDREAVPRAQDFLTAMKRTDGALCVRWAGPPGVSAGEVCRSEANAGSSDRRPDGARGGSSERSSDGECFVRYANSAWERAAHDRLRGRTTVETVGADRVQRWFRNGRPELVAYDEVRGSFEADAPRTTADRSPPRGATPVATDGGSTSSDATGGSSDRKPDFENEAGETVRVRRGTDLRRDPALGRGDAEAVAAALPAGADEIVFWLPLALAEETVLASTARSDRVFVAEVVPERETDRAHYVRQGRRGGWIPKGEARVYEVADSGVGEGVEDRRESA